MISLLWICIIGSTAVSCKKGGTTIVAETLAIKVDTIAAGDSIPEEVEGAGCIYYATKHKLVNEVRPTDEIFISGEPYAVMKLDGRMELLELKEINKNLTKKLYRNKQYKVLVHIIKETPWPDEETGAVLHEGTICASSRPARCPSSPRSTACAPPTCG